MVTSPNSAEKKIMDQKQIGFLFLIKIINLNKYF